MAMENQPVIPNSHDFLAEQLKISPAMFVYHRVVGGPSLIKVMPFHLQLVPDIFHLIAIFFVCEITVTSNSYLSKNRRNIVTTDTIYQLHWLPKAPLRILMSSLVISNSWIWPTLTCHWGLVQPCLTVLLYYCLIIDHTTWSVVNNPCDSKSLKWV